ncbi:MAG: hypothetical protein KAT68_11315 [Bacteroidales bacterium]|nr:hypothetical protein [Bacteroidales bacterium]
MYKIYLPILISLIFFISCVDSEKKTGQEDKSDTSNPRIKLCKIFSYKYIGGVPVDTILLEEFQYDSVGHETELTRYNTDGTVSSTFKFKYDASGNLTERIWKEAYVKKEDKEVITLDKWDRMEDIKNQSIGNINKETYKYDKKGNLVEKIWNDPYRKSAIKEEYKYYEDGREIEVGYYNSDNILKRKDIHKFDNKGNELEFLTYNKNGELINKTTYEYDKYGNIIKDIYWDNKLNKPEQVIRYIYEFYE